MRISPPEWVAVGFPSRRENAEQNYLGWEAQPSSQAFPGPALTCWFPGCRDLSTSESKPAQLSAICPELGLPGQQGPVLDPRTRAGRTTSPAAVMRPHTHKAQVCFSLKGTDVPERQGHFLALSPPQNHSSSWVRPEVLPSVDLQKAEL